MAESKKSFLLYVDLIHTVKKMPKGKVADLFMTILQYVNDENPEVKDLTVALVFEPIKHQLKRDLKRWEDFKEKQSQNGKLGGRPKKPTKTQKKPKNPSLSDETQKSLNATVTVTVSKERVQEPRAEESAIKEPEIPTKTLQESNLFRKPIIPTFDEVHRIFIQQGGTKEMAEKFFNKHEATEWFIRGSPVKNVAALINNFRANWNEIADKTKPEPKEDREAIRKNAERINQKYSA